MKNNDIDYKIKYEFSDTRSVVDYINKGKGIGIIPRKIAEVSNLKIKDLNVNVKYDINILYVNENLSSSAKEFIEFLLK